MERTWPFPSWVSGAEKRDSCRPVAKSSCQTVGRAAHLTVSQSDPEEMLMSDNRNTTPQAVPPHVQLIQMAAGSWVAAIVYAAAKLGLADHLAAGPPGAPSNRPARRAPTRRHCIA